MKTDTLWTSLVGGLTASITYLIGGVDELAIALGILMFIDYILGLSVACTVNKNVESRKMFKGLLKKMAMLFMVIVAVQMDNATNSGDFMRNAMILFLIGMEGISFIENLGHLGIKVPSFIKDAFTQLQNENDKKSGDK
ncbi:phage holin family protein [Ureibacillus composti]|nr:phage holin family protein [Ureibacillus composti]